MPGQDRPEEKKTDESLNAQTGGEDICSRGGKEYANYLSSGRECVRMHKKRHQEGEGKIG